MVRTLVSFVLFKQTKQTKATSIKILTVLLCRFSTRQGIWCKTLTIMVLIFPNVLFCSFFS